MNNAISFPTVIGHISIIEENDSIIAVSFSKIQQPCYNLTETPLLREAATEISAFLNGKLKAFSIPYKLHGTCFQEKVWSALMTIPYGETCTYKDIAKLINQPKAYRAVGNANNKNNLPLIIPCHRVIGSNNKPVGYNGGLQIKEYLLNLETKTR